MEVHRSSRETGLQPPLSILKTCLFTLVVGMRGASRAATFSSVACLWGLSPPAHLKLLVFLLPLSLVPFVVLQFRLLHSYWVTDPYIFLGVCCSPTVCGSCSFHSHRPLLSLLAQRTFLFTNYSQPCFPFSPESSPAFLPFSPFMATSQKCL